MGLAVMKNYLLRCWSCLLLLISIRVSFIFSVARTTLKNIGALILFMKLGSVLSLYKSILEPCIENCCHVGSGASNCFFAYVE